MASSIASFSTQSRGKNYEGGITGFVVVSCMVAGMGGLNFGYDIGISGGVTSMDSFLSQFFPTVHERTHEASYDNIYCKYESPLVQLFTSSLYLAALLAAFFASAVTRIFGRRISMLLGGSIFLVGAIFNGAATNVSMLIAGRLLLGVGVGFSNQSVPVYLSEMAPPKLRGALNIGFQLFITIGILAANLINYVTSKIKGGYGWRISLVLAAVPAIMIIVGSVFLPDTPNSILERGNTEEAKQMLRRIRGTYNVEEEFKDLIDASQAAKKVEHPWKNILKPRYRPQLTMCAVIPFFQQFTGINVIMFYGPVLFKTLGFGNDAALIYSVVTGLVNLLATGISIFSADLFGRRVLFLQGGVQMIICQVVIVMMIGIKFGANGEGTLTEYQADFVVILFCLYVAAFAWSWGPLGWLVPSEICPLEIRSAGQAINVSVNMFSTFLIGQFFLSMLCQMKFGLFLFFAAHIIVMTTFIYFFLPETKNVPIEEMNSVWRAHWFWGKYIPDEAIIGDPPFQPSPSFWWFC